MVKCVLQSYYHSIHSMKFLTNSFKANTVAIKCEMQKEELHVITRGIWEKSMFQFFYYQQGGIYILVWTPSQDISLILVEWQRTSFCSPEDHLWYKQDIPKEHHQLKKGLLIDFKTLENFLSISNWPSSQACCPLLRIW